MRYAPEDEELDRDERTLDVMFWLFPVGAGAAVALPLLIGVAVLLRVDMESFPAVLVVGLPAVATVGSGVRHALRPRTDGLAIDRPDRVGQSSGSGEIGHRGDPDQGGRG